MGQRSNKAVQSHFSISLMAGGTSRLQRIRRYLQLVSVQVVSMSLMSKMMNHATLAGILRVNGKAPLRRLGYCNKLLGKLTRKPRIYRSLPFYKLAHHRSQRSCSEIKPRTRDHGVCEVISSCHTLQIRDLLSQLHLQGPVRTM